MTAPFDNWKQGAILMAWSHDKHKTSEVFCVSCAASFMMRSMTEAVHGPYTVISPFSLCILLVRGGLAIMTALDQAA